MITLFRFTICAGISLLLLWAAYRIIVRRSAGLSARRAIIIGIYVLSLTVLPAVAVCLYSHNLSDANGIALRRNYTLSEGLKGGLLWPSRIWATGAGVVLVLTCGVVVRAMLIMKRSRKVAGESVYVTPDSRIAPFTLGSRVVVSEADYAEAGAMILAHERVHSGRRHWIDMAIAQLTAAMCWYNPAAWLLRRELVNLHEYEADAAVLASGADAREYQLYLIGRASGWRRGPGVNGLRSGELKRRIAMMKYAAPQRGGRLRGYCGLLAGVAVCCGVYACPGVGAVVNPVSVFYTSVRAVYVEPGSGEGAGARLFVDGKEVSVSELNNIPASEIREMVIDKQKGEVSVIIK